MGVDSYELIRTNSMTIDGRADCATARTMSSALGRTECEKMDLVGERTQDTVTCNNIRGNSRGNIKVHVILAYSMEPKVTSTRIDCVKSRNRADIPSEEKILCGESLFVLKQQSGAKVSAISAMKAQKCLRRDHPATLATVTDVEAKEKRIEDPPIVRDSSQCAT
ncbi:hypothetical protein Hanom_Chr16g01492221 [Helianthus anomalus]